MVSPQPNASTSIGPAFINRISKLPVTKTSFGAHGGRAKRKAPAIREPKTWLLSLRLDATYPGNEEQVSAIASEEQEKVNSTAGEVDWFWWSARRGFPVKARQGDIIIQCCRPQAKIQSSRSVRVYRHARLIRVYQERGQKARTFHCLFPPDWERRALTWSEFATLATRSGITRKLSYRSTIQLSEQQSNALFELWPK